MNAFISTGQKLEVGKIYRSPNELGEQGRKENSFDDGYVYEVEILPDEETGIVNINMVTRFKVVQSFGHAGEIGETPDVSGITLDLE